MTKIKALLSLFVVLLVSVCAFAQIGPTRGRGSSSGPSFSTFAAALNADLPGATSRVDRIVVLGDSLSYCTFSNCSPSFSTTLWVNLLRTRVQTKYGNHGTGLMPFRAHVDQTSSNQDLVASVTNTSTNNPGGCQENTLYQVGAGGSDVTGTGCYSFTASGVVVNSTAQTYDAATFYYQTCCNVAGAALQIDGNSLGTVANYAAADCCTPAKTSVAAPGGLGSHTFTLTLNTGGTIGAYLYAFEGSIGSTGVSVDNLSTGSARAEWYSPLNASQGFNGAATAHTALSIPMQAWSSNLAHTFFVIQLGTNDFLNGTVTAYGGNLGPLVYYLIQAGVSPTHILLVNPPFEGPYNGTVTAFNDQTAYASTTSRVAAQYGTGYLSMCDSGIDVNFCSFNAANTAGYMISDLTHMTAAGQTAWFNDFVKALGL